MAQNDQKERQVEGVCVSIAGRFPDLCYFSYALYSAWIMGMIFDPQLVSSIPVTQDRGFILGYILSGIPLSLCLLLAGIFDKRFDALLKRPVFVVLTALLASVCTYLLVADIPISPLVASVFMAGTGVGTAFVCLRTGMVTSELTGTKALFTLGAMALLSFVICYAIKGMPFPLDSLTLASLPVMAAVVSLFHGSDIGVENDPADVIPKEKLPSGFILRLIIAIFVFSCATGVARAFDSMSNADSLMGFEPFTAFVLIVVLLFIIAVISGKHSINVGAIYLPLCLVMTLAMLLSSIVGEVTSVQGLVSGSLYDIFVLMVWCLLCELAGRIDLTSTRVFGFGRFASAIGTTIGQALVLFVATYLEVSATFSIAICVIMSVVLILAFTYLLNAKTIEGALEILYAERTKESSHVTGHVCGEVARQGTDGQNAFEMVCKTISNKYNLTQREAETFNLLARGRSINYIAESLVIANSTVKGYTKNIYAKLSIHSRQELIDLMESELLKFEPQNRL